MAQPARDLALWTDPKESGKVLGAATVVYVVFGVYKLHLLSAVATTLLYTLLLMAAYRRGRREAGGALVASRSWLTLALPAATPSSPPSPS